MAKRNWWLVIVIAVVVATACSTTTPTSAPTGAPTSPPTDVPGPTAAPTSPPTDVPGPTDAPTSSPTDVPPPSADAVPEVPTGFAELDAALGADQPMKRTKVTIQVPWIGVEGDNFENSLKDFEAATGIDVVVDRVASSHETVLRTRIDVNDPTLNLAMLSQPAAILAYGAEGKMVDVNSFMTGTNLADEHPATIGLYTNESGATYGVPYKVDVKSTVWYPIKAFGAAGYTVPTTWDELIDLSQRIVDEQGESNPWCIGMEDGSETGGQATDWLEDIMLRTTSVENYNKWITHELPFNSPEVLDAMNLAGQIFFTPDFVLGGPEGAITIHQTDAMDPMFPTDGNWEGFTPGCWMQKQATWYGPDFFPDVKANPGTPSQFPVGDDIGLFYFPPIDPAFGNPTLGAGDALMVIQPPDGSAPSDSTKAVAEFLSLPQGLQRWIEAGSAISANQSTPDAWYAGSYKLSVAASIVSNATSFGFDASDLMPTEVVAGAEWLQLSEWVLSGGTAPTAQQALEAIDAAWPR